MRSIDFDILSNFSSCKLISAWFSGDYLAQRLGISYIFLLCSLAVHPVHVDATDVRDVRLFIQYLAVLPALDHVVLSIGSELYREDADQTVEEQLN